MAVDYFNLRPLLVAVMSDRWEPVPSNPPTIREIQLLAELKKLGGVGEVPPGMYHFNMVPGMTDWIITFYPAKG